MIRSQSLFPSSQCTDKHCLGFVQLAVLMQQIRCVIQIIQLTFTWSFIPITHCPTIIIHVHDQSSHIPCQPITHLGTNKIIHTCRTTLFLFDCRKNHFQIFGIPCFTLLHINVAQRLHDVIKVFSQRFQKSRLLCRTQLHSQLRFHLDRTQYLPQTPCTCQWNGCIPRTQYQHRMSNFTNGGRKGTSPPFIRQIRCIPLVIHKQIYPI